MPRISPGAVGEAGVGGSGPGFGWARARRAGVKVFWLYLGERDARHYYVSADKHAGVVTPQYFEALEFNGDGGVFVRIIDEVCKLAQTQPYALVRLPRDAPPLLHIRNGELWLALDDWPQPSDVLRLGRLPYSGPETKCDISYALDIARRERSHNAYIRVVRAPHCTVFCFQIRSSTVVVAERPW
jgi:hypothetical protein